MLFRLSNTIFSHVKRSPKLPFFSFLVLLVCMLIMYCQSYSFPKAIPNPKPQDVGKTNNDFIGTLLSSDRDGDFFPVNANGTV